MTHHPLCMTLWSGEAGHCECPETNTCRACPDTCKECTWDNGTCECYEHEEHLYLSTACLHGQHEHCRSTVAAEIAEVIEQEAERLLKLPFTGLITDAVVGRCRSDAEIARQFAAEPTGTPKEPTHDGCGEHCIYCCKCEGCSSDRDRLVGP